MTNTLVLQIALSSETEKLLTQIVTVCAQQNVAFFVAGATAREVLIHHIHGRRPGRRTSDIDIAIFVDDWSSFTELQVAFIAEGATTTKGNPHHLIWAENHLDIIPFGGVAEENKIAWPPDRAIVMNVDGFREAFEHTVVVRLFNGAELPFCSLPGLAMLKIFAWQARGHGNGKDAIDLFTIISEYGNIEEERIWDAPLEEDDLDADLERMGAFLLGLDIAALLQQSSHGITAAQLLSLQSHKIVDAIVSQNTRETPDRIEQLVEDFWRGIAFRE